MEDQKTYYVTVHGEVFSQVDDESIAYRKAALYRKLGLQAEVTDQEPI